MNYIREISILFIISCLLCTNASAANVPQDLKKSTDTIPLYSGGKIRKSIYPQDERKRSMFYNYLWGKHYRDLYFMPITVQSARLNTIYGGLTFVDQLPRLHAIVLGNKSGNYYLLRPVGGSTTFLESDFFKQVYSKQEFKDTYLDKFISDAYTITHPYAFLIANKLADDIDVSSLNPKIYYIPKKTTTDTIIDGTGIEDRLVSIYDLKKFTIHTSLIETEDLLRKIRENKSFLVDQDKYIRERLLDMLIGDWNTTTENWKWYEELRNDSLIYTPLVLDRSHAFTKVGGVLFKGVLGMLGLNNITNYNSRDKNLRKTNTFSLPLDIAITAGSNRADWIKQAKQIKSILTDALIDEAFKELPKEIYKLEDTRIIKRNLKKRRNAVENIAQEYYKILQQTPVVTGTNKDDLFVIERKDKHATTIRIYDKESDRLVFDKDYDKSTQQIWLYGLDGNDEFKVSGKSKNGTPLVLIGGKDTNTYKIEKGREIRVYDYNSHVSSNDSLAGANIIQTDIEKVNTYDYQKIRHQTLGFTPWWIYDSDLGLYIGAYITKTMYGFKQSPYTYQHRFGYSYLDGLMYQGFFPTLDEMKSLNIEAFIGMPYNFFNFFGYGNQTNGYKEEKNDYNRINISRYSIQPSFYWKFDAKHKLIAQIKLELFNIKRPTDRFINTLYDDNDKVFKTKTFADANLTYEISRNLGPILPLFKFSLTPGWKVNVSDLGRNVPYIESTLSFNLAYGDRLSLGTEIKGTTLFSNKYEFYQAASVELRGFRNNRFIGRQSLYQHTDLRLDLGHLKNPFTPLLYGVFLGFDYGRVWYPDEYSRKWHTSYGGGWWITLFKNYTGKFSYFASKDGGRFSFGLGLGF